MIQLIIAIGLLVSVILLFGIRLEADPHVSATNLFPVGHYACWSCTYFKQALSDPEHAQTACPECGLTLLPEEKTS